MAEGMGSPITRVVGLTGGIACGKSTVADVFRRRGVEVIDADQLAREVVRRGEPAFQLLVDAFGSEILGEDGELDRAALGKKAFSDPARLKLLNAATHPAILAKTGQRLAAAQRARLGWVVYEAPLILENQAQHGLSGLVVVLCPKEAQLARLMARSGLSAEDAQARVAAQTDDATRRAFGTWLIENDRDIKHLEERADAVYAAIVARFGPHERREDG